MFFPFGRVCGWRGFVSVWFYRKTLEGQMERVNVVPSSSSSSCVFAHMMYRRTRDHSCRYNGLCRAAPPEGENPFETP